MTPDSNQNSLNPNQGANSHKKSGEKKNLTADIRQSNKAEEAGISITQSKVVVNDEGG